MFAPAKNCAQSDCKNFIGLIEGATSLPRLLKSRAGGVSGLRNVRLCRFFDLSRKPRNLIPPYVSPMCSGGLFAEPIVGCDCSFDGLRELAWQEQAGVFRNFFKGFYKPTNWHFRGCRSRDRERAGYLKS